MILKLQVFLLWFPLALAQEETLVLTSHGLKRREARLAERELAKRERNHLSVLLGNHLSLLLGDNDDCSNEVGSGCWTAGDCCGPLECLGVVNWQCGNSPGLEGEYCNLSYPCDEHLLCHEGECEEYENVLLKGERGQCKAGSPAGQFKMMSYNTFLINCLDGLVGEIAFEQGMKCQVEEGQKDRIANMMLWMQERDEDVVVFQELFNLRDDIINGMGDAGFCHYVSTPFGATGSGLAIFSKHEILEINFIDWFDFTGENSDTLIDPEALADKGVMYARIQKDGKIHHVYNTHTQSDSIGDQHEVRMDQYIKIREFVEETTEDRPVSEDLVLLGGDFNENKYKEGNDEKYYNEMLYELNAHEPQIRGDLQYSLDTNENPFLANLWDGSSTPTFTELLDYVLVSDYGLVPSDSYCEIIKAEYPTSCGSADCMLSDHFPNSCTMIY